jgi:hypothetical protein
MVESAGGSFLVTGGMPTPDPRYTSLSLGKAGVRTLVTLLDMRYREMGVHVASVTITEPVMAGTRFDPDEIAESYWRLHIQHRDHWQQEFIFDGKGNSS